MLSFLRSTPGHQLPRSWRSLSTSRPHRLNPQHSIYVSTSTNPYFNLTLEDWLFKHKSPGEPLLLIYRDDPCVVIGRNQNPWKEVNMPALQRAGIPFIRRRSGGGTVFHDTGNTNFSIHLPRTSFDRHATAQIILRAVRSLGIDARVNDRNDVCVGSYKVSGSAYKIVKDRAYHHGTMLISTQLSTLGDVLHVDKDSMVTRGVASVRSPVRNLREFQLDVTHEAFLEATVNAFREDYAVEEPVQEVHEDAETTSIEAIKAGMSELPSWDWVYGQTPEFTYTIHQPFAWGDVTAEIRSKHGIILSCSFDTNNQSKLQAITAVGRLLEGKKYGLGDVQSVSSLIGEEPTGNEIYQWLAEAMNN